MLLPVIDRYRAHPQTVARNPQRLMMAGIDRQAKKPNLLRRLGRKVDSANAYDAAIARTENAAERAFLQRSRQALNRA